MDNNVSISLSLTSHTSQALHFPKLVLHNCLEEKQETRAQEYETENKSTDTKS